MQAETDSVDIVRVDARDAGTDDTPGTDMIQEVCGSLTTNPDRVKGQPCEVEGESYCTDVGAYPGLLAVIGWQCINPGIVACVKNEDGNPTWKLSNCEKNFPRLRHHAG